MQSTSTWNLKQRLQQIQGLDWNFLKGSALLSVGMAAARVMGLGFSLLLAAAFLPAAYGTFQYSLTVALIFGIATQPFGQHVIARFVAVCQQDPVEINKVLSNALLVLIALFVLTMIVSIPVLMALGVFNIGTMVVILGITVFYAYWGLSRGLLASGRLTIAFLGSNLVQLLATFVLIYMLQIQSVTLALVIYGLSYFLPLTLLQIYKPLPTYLSFDLVDQATIKQLLKFSWPIWISHTAYMFSISVDVILLKMFSGVQVVGVYSAAKTTSMVFMFVPMAIATLIMPKTATLSRTAYAGLLKKSIIGSVIINVLGLVAYLALIRWFILTMFGSEYVVDMTVYIVLALGAIIGSIGTIIAAVLVGAGRPRFETVSNIIGLTTIAVGGLLLVPIYGIIGMAVALLMGAVTTTLFYILVTLKVIRNPKAASTQ